MYHCFDKELNGENDLDSFKEISLKIKPDWQNKEMELKCLTGGLTNSLYACFLKQNGFNSKETILFRIYGQETDKFISRSNEIETMIKTSNLGLGSKFYGKFKNGICYEFLSGQILTHSMVYDKDIYPKIAKAIAKLHSIDFNGVLTNENMPVNKETVILPLTSKICNLINENYKSFMSDEMAQTVPSKADLTKEFHFLQSYLTEYTSKNNSLIVYGHNDLNPGNLIYNSNDENQIKFIDYDYSGFEYRAFDIANHFVEYCGIYSDYSDYPNEEYQLNWLSIYLNEFNRLVNPFYKDDPSKQLILTDEKLLQFYEEVNLFALVSHFIAVVWCVVQKETSNIDFDYIDLMHKRLSQYNSFKTKLIK